MRRNKNTFKNNKELFEKTNSMKLYNAIINKNEVVSNIREKRMSK